MKRPYSDGDKFSRGGGGSKRQRSDPFNDALSQGKFELRLLIPTKVAGALIGKGGENIKSLRDKVNPQFKFRMEIAKSRPKEAWKT